MILRFGDDPMEQILNGTNPEHKMKEIKRNKSASHEVKKHENALKHD